MRIAEPNLTRTTLAESKRKAVDGDKHLSATQNLPNEKSNLGEYNIFWLYILYCRRCSLNNKSWSQIKNIFVFARWEN